MHIVELIAFKNAYILINSLGVRLCIGRQFGILILIGKSQQLKKKVLKPDTPQEIRDAFEKHQEELKKPVHGFVDK
ncbi:hypothetical protein [Holdemanella biformis]|uniref:hypothetical protein n=1 Tax=Holdemanella biformis TaxID=1735 RepID=UPI002666541C|nr:hypothetical protein [Holdemanella biformis]